MVVVFVSKYYLSTCVAAKEKARAARTGRDGYGLQARTVYSVHDIRGKSKHPSTRGPHETKSARFLRQPPRRNSSEVSTLSAVFLPVCLCASYLC